MAGTGAFQILPSALTALLLVLPGYRCTAGPPDIHSLCLSFTVKDEPVTRQLWSEVQCSVDGVPFLQYSDNKAKLLGTLGKEVNATKLLDELIPRIKYIGREFKMKLLNRQLSSSSKGHPPLQAKVFCQREGKQLIDASWQFTVNGQYSFLFYPINWTWILINPEAKHMMKKCQDENGLADDLDKISRGDCPDWLKKLPKHPKETPGPTPKFPNTSQLLSTTGPPSMTQNTSNSWAPSTETIVLIVVGMFLFSFSSWHLC